MLASLMALDRAHEMQLCQLAFVRRKKKTILKLYVLVRANASTCVQ